MNGKEERCLRASMYYNYLMPRRVKKLSRSFRSVVTLNYIYILAESDGFVVQQKRFQFHDGQNDFFFFAENEKQPETRFTHR